MPSVLVTDAVVIGVCGTSDVDCPVEVPRAVQRTATTSCCDEVIDDRQVGGCAPPSLQPIGHPVGPKNPVSHGMAVG